MSDLEEEVFDIVNELDEVIGQAPRSRIHQQRLNHRAVHILVRNNDGNIFLQKRSLTKDCFPGTWDSSAAGHLHTGEGYDACAWRELKEELGIEPVAPIRPLFKLPACPETGQEFCWVYQTEHEGPFQLHPEEIETGAWFAPEEIDRWLKRDPAAFAGAVPLIWQHYFQP